MAFKSQAELDEALRVGTLPPEACVVDLLPQTDEEVKQLFELDESRTPEDFDDAKFGADLPGEKVNDLSNLQPLPQEIEALGTDSVVV